MVNFNGTMQSNRSRWSQVAGGGARGTNVNPSQYPIKPGPHGEAFDRGDEASSVGFYQNAAAQGTAAIGAQSAIDFRRALGEYLGGLNSIGGLRSGAVESGANDIMDTYSRNFATEASKATLGAIGYGAQTTAQELDNQRAAADRKSQRKNSTIGAVGQLLGAGVGLIGGRIFGGKKK